MSLGKVRLTCLYTQYDSVHTGAMNGWVSYALRYPTVLATLIVAVVGGVCQLSGEAVIAQWIVSAFALVVAAIQARGMIEDLRRGSYGIDILAVTAICSTVAVGEYWAALIVCLMLSGGEALEDFAEHRAKRELTDLLAHAPAVAHRLDSEGAPVDIAIEDVRIGDRLAVRPFEMIPVDGVLESDGATLDESSLTGESLPVERVCGEQVLSGAVNGSNAIVIRASASASDSQFQRIIALVREAQESKSPFVRLADRVAVPFTVFALLLAGAAWLVSKDASRFAEVLVVATPCPLIIAAPVAFLGGMSRSARAGIIIKDAGTLERLAAVRTAAFDKTGTLTYGTPQLTAIVPAKDSTVDLLSISAAIEQYSNHPLARSIVEASQQRSLVLPQATEVTEIPGCGVRGVVDGSVAEVGKAAFIAEVTGADPIATDVGETGVHVSIDGTYCGVLVLADAVRPEAQLTMETLLRNGVSHTMMITGDRHEVASYIATQTGLTDIRADLLPEDKVEAVTHAPQRLTLMVGDGVNDAPSLAAADVGIAMGARGSTAASESADVVIMLDDISRVARAVLIGKRTMRVAWQAIGIGVGLSVGLMLIAAFGLLPAVAGALLQEFVDLACILWALLAIRPSAAERELAPVSRETGLTGARETESLVSRET